MSLCTYTWDFNDVWIGRMLDLRRFSESIELPLDVLTLRRRCRCKICKRGGIIMKRSQWRVAIRESMVVAVCQDGSPERRDDEPSRSRHVFDGCDGVSSSGNSARAHTFAHNWYFRVKRMYRAIAKDNTHHKDDAFTVIATFYRALFFFL